MKGIKKKTVKKRKARRCCCCCCFFFYDDLFVSIFFPPFFFFKKKTEPLALPGRLFGMKESKKKKKGKNLLPPAGPPWMESVCVCVCLEWVSGCLGHGPIIASGWSGFLCNARLLPFAAGVPRRRRMGADNESRAEYKTKQNKTKQNKTKPTNQPTNLNPNPNRTKFERDQSPESRWKERRRRRRRRCCRPWGPVDRPWLFGSWSYRLLTRLTRLDWISTGFQSKFSRRLSKKKIEFRARLVPAKF